jgi:hypothetical protein
MTTVFLFMIISIMMAGRSNIYIAGEDIVTKKEKVATRRGN